MKFNLKSGIRLRPWLALPNCSCALCTLEFWEVSTNRKEKEQELFPVLPILFSSFASVCLCMSQGVDIGHTCVLVFDLVLNPINDHISTFVEPFMVGFVFARQVEDFVQPVFTSVSLVVCVWEGIPFFHGHDWYGLTHQLGFFSLFNMEHPFHVAAIPCAFTSFYHPSWGQTFAIVYINNFFINEEKQVSLCAIQQVVVVQEVFKCHVNLSFKMCSCVPYMTYYSACYPVCQVLFFIFSKYFLFIFLDIL